MQVHDIPLAAIDENEDNRYDQRNIDELAESIQWSACSSRWSCRQMASGIC